MSLRVPPSARPIAVRLERVGHRLIVQRSAGAGLRGWFAAPGVAQIVVDGQPRPAQLDGDRVLLDLPP